MGGWASVPGGVRVADRSRNLLLRRRPRAPAPRNQADSADRPDGLYPLSGCSLSTAARTQASSGGHQGCVQSRLASLGKDHEVEIYPEGGHGFFCEDRSAYHRGSAEAAWKRATTLAGGEARDSDAGLLNDLICAGDLLERVRSIGFYWAAGTGWAQRFQHPGQLGLVHRLAYKIAHSGGVEAFLAGPEPRYLRSARRLGRFGVPRWRGFFWWPQSRPFQASGNP